MLFVIPEGSRLELTCACFTFNAFITSLSYHAVEYFFPNKTNAQKLKLNAIPLSFIHAMTANILALMIILGDDNEILLNDRSFGTTTATKFLNAFSCGYFLFDILIVLHAKPVDLPFMLHAIVCFGAYWVAQEPYFNYYTSRFLLFELSTPLLNLKNFVTVIDASKKTQNIVNQLFGVAFVGCRIIYGVPVAYDFIKYLLELVNDANNNKMNLIVLYFSIFAIGSMTFLNVTWVLLASIPEKKETKEKVK